ncbi:class I adenylate-forming enzyme family protein [Sphingomonas sp. PAMC 26605]|uniref:class I adenylate-forming enzyme family protein n=1 Tax=Sphingomonas sp. PAMC 26605 TaxID=1112214 RepID=UPI00026CB5C0|nr:class I adenylate-forming enzyme family protein [Sphingomonas sp. PAMC 26605]
MQFLSNFLDTAQAHPKNVAIFWKQKLWTYAKLLDDVDEMVDALVDAGVQPGDRVSISMQNSPNLAISLLACMRAGFVAAPINTRFKATETLTALDLIEPTLHLGSGGMSADLSGISAQALPFEARVILADEGGASQAMKAARGRGGNRLRSTANDVDAPALLLPTSGTTGKPKIVAHTLATLGAITERYGALGLRDDDVMLNVGPMIHAGGLFNFFASLVRSGPMVMVGPFEAGAVLNAIEFRRCTWMKALPFAFRELIDAQHEHPRDVSSLRFCVASGDTAPARLHRDFEATFGLPLHACWASTEAATSLSFGAPGDSSYAAIAPGQIVLRELDNEAGDDLALGELLVRGPHVSPGYWSAGAVQPGRGWFETGDVFQRREDGTLSFVSRQKNLIIRGGSNISPLEVEEALRTHPGVSDAAVYGVPDEQLGERVGALIELAASSSFSLTDILDQLRGQLSEYKVPEIATIVLKLPRNGNGKVDRAAISQIPFTSNVAAKTDI